MTINLHMPDIRELKPHIIVFGVGGAGGNAVNNMIRTGLEGVDFVVANTDAQALSSSRCERVIQMGVAVTQGLGAGSQPEVGRAAAEEMIDEIRDHLSGAHMVFITAGMGGGTGTGAAPVIAEAAREMGILTVGVVTKPFHFEGQRRLRVADAGILELQKHVDTLIVIPNQNLFRIANEKTTFADAFAMADQVLYSGVACITDLMVKEGLINLDFADVRSIMRGMGKAMMGTGEASGDKRAIQAAEAAISNPLLDETSMRGARGLLISITGGNDLTLFEVDEAATRIREEVDPDANIILGATFDESLEGIIRVSVVATGIDQEVREDVSQAEIRMAELTRRLRTPANQQQPQQAARQSVPLTAAARPHAAAGGREQAQARRGDSQAEPASLDPDVTIAPFNPAPALFPETAAADVTEPAAPYSGDEVREPFMPPVAERPEGRGPRMPRVEDFPPIAQRELRAHERGERGPAQDERGPMSLLRRLATVGLGRREEDVPRVAEPPRHVAPAESGERRAQRLHVPEARMPQEPMPESRQHAPRSAHVEPPPQPVPQPQPAPELRRPQRHAEVAYHPRASEPEQHPRVAPRPLPEDDQLEIPAFLRRQAT